MSARAASQSGFTLIEAMVALVILGIASVGIVRAAEAHIDMVGGLERRAAAQWAAENALVEMELGPSAAANSAGEVNMLGWRWNVRTALTGSADPDMQLATVTVSPAGTGENMVTLRGFADRRTVTR